MGESTELLLRILFDIRPVGAAEGAFLFADPKISNQSALQYGARSAISESWLTLM